MFEIEKSEILDREEKYKIRECLEIGDLPCRLPYAHMSIVVVFFVVEVEGLLVEGLTVEGFGFDPDDFAVPFLSYLLSFEYLKSFELSLTTYTN